MGVVVGGCACISRSFHFVHLMICGNIRSPEFWKGRNNIFCFMFIRLYSPSATILWSFGCDA